LFPSSLLTSTPVSPLLSSSDSSSSSLASSVLLGDGDGEGGTAAPCTAVTFAVCHSDKGELDEEVV